MKAMIYLNGRKFEPTLPKRFVTQDHPSLPQIIIHDVASRKSTSVPISEYKAVKKALHDLFGSSADEVIG